MHIRIEPQNEEVFAREILRFTKDAQDFRVIAPALLVTIRQIVREQFAAQGRGVIGNWKKLSIDYAKAKEKKYPGKTILRASDKLFDSLISRTNYSIVSIRKSELIYGTNVPYAAFHEDGTRKMTRRPIFDLRETDRERLIKAAQARLVQLAKTGQ